ncbi:phage scaffolding protein [Lederbergia lenta]|uniref:phage scaffolding protein n=1 Tax=Lederbergia lenta TaxID=1467 RepID=UPI00203F2F40|nr:phage scaffolding protein [Lederbergia lenta]MCM3110677.1 phage scaffolding protein [Lederbergia lenta]
MNREELKELGLSDEQIDKVMASHGKVVNATKEKADKVESLESQIEDYKGQLADRDTQLQELGEKAKGNEELTAQIEDLKQQNETTKSEYEGKLEKQAFDHKLENSLSGAKVKNTKALRALLDMDTIKLDGDVLKGLDNQLDALKESDAYLFETEEAPPNSPTIVTSGNPNGGTNTGNDDPFAAKLAKYN